MDAVELRGSYARYGREWAQRAVLLGIAGSHAHGTHVPPDEEHGTDDTDVVAVFVHPMGHYLGVSGYNRYQDGFDTNGQHVDICAYDVPKFVSLLGKGNPNVHFWLWQPDDLPLLLDEGGQLLVAARERLLSQAMFPALMGYAVAQLKKMRQGHTMGYMGAKRKELLREYGYDIKDAAHCLRLLHVGRVLAAEGRLMVRLEGDILADVLAVKTGKRSLREVEAAAEKLFAEFADHRSRTALRERVPVEELDALSAAVIHASWGQGTVS